MHDAGVRTEELQLLRAELEAARVDLRGLALRLIPLVLDARHVHRVRNLHGRLEIVADLVLDALPLQNRDDVVRNLQFLRRNEDLLHVVEVGEKVRERTDRPPPEEIAAEDDRPPVHAALRLEGADERVDVEKRLGRMLVLPGSRVQDRDRALAVRELPRRLLGKALLGTAHDDHVDVARERADRVDL